MSPDDTTLPGPLPEPTPGPIAIVSSGWLGPQSVFEHRDERKIGRAMMTSLVLHGGFAAGLIALLTVGPAQVLLQPEHMEYKVVFLPDPGRGGGGGGSPAPAPKRELAIPKHQAPAAVPMPVLEPIDPPPALLAPIQTNAALLQSAGNSSISLSILGGGGSGGGIGPGKGNGVGPGTGGGFGGGAYQPGNGVSWPEKLVEVKPKYTPDAMRAKIQGEVQLEIVVLEDGSVGQVRIIKGLDRASGLDDAAIDAAKKWRFKPGMKEGKPVATWVKMTLEFRLH